MSVRYIAGVDTSRFRFDEEGICEPAWRIGNLEWRDIREVSLTRDGTCEYICVVVRDRMALRSRLGFLGRLFSNATRTVGHGDLTINATRRGIKGDDAVEFASSMITASLEKKVPNHPTEPRSPGLGGSS